MSFDKRRTYSDSEICIAILKFPLSNLESNYRLLIVTSSNFYD